MPGQVRQSRVGRRDPACSGSRRRLRPGLDTGVGRDASGAVFPGVTVEAASPALIEKTRTVVTGANGQHRIVDLRPGAYTVTFTLAGFSTVAERAWNCPARSSPA